MLIRMTARPDSAGWDSSGGIGVCAGASIRTAEGDALAVAWTDVPGDCLTFVEPKETGEAACCGSVFEGRSEAAADVPDNIDLFVVGAAVEVDVVGAVAAEGEEGAGGALCWQSDG